MIIILLHGRKRKHGQKTELKKRIEILTNYLKI